MARPKAAEETKVVTIRLPLSAWTAWDSRARSKGVSMGTLLRAKLVEAVMPDRVVPVRQPRALKPERAPKPKVPDIPGVTKGLERSAVQPNFKETKR